jgi:hypothetical protein
MQQQTPHLSEAEFSSGNLEEYRQRGYFFGDVASQQGVTSIFSANTQTTELLERTIALLAIRRGEFRDLPSNA